MGRGRAKAKQTKVARELKYSSHPTDLDALQRELGGGSGHSTDAFAHDPHGGPDDDEYDPDDWASASR